MQETQTPEALLSAADELLCADPSRAAEIGRELLSAASDPALRLWAGLIQAEAAWRLGQTEDAHAHLLELGSLPGRGALAPRYHLLLAQVQGTLGDAAASRAGLERAARLASRLGQLGLQADALSLLAREQHRCGEGVAALATLDRALALREQGGDVAGEIRALSNKTLILIAQGNTALALELLTRAQERTLESATPLVSELHVRSSLGLLLEQMGRPEEAYAHFIQAREVAQAAGDRPALAAMSLNAGEIARQLGRLDEAEPLLRAALEDARSLGETRVQGAALHSLGVLYSARGQSGDLARAEEALSEAEATAQQSGDLDAEIEALLGRAQHWLSQDGARRALPALTRALTLAEGGQRLQASLSAHLLLADAHEHRAPRQAIAHLRAAKDLERQLRDVALAQQARDLTAEAELDSARRRAEHERQLRAASDAAREQAEATVQSQLKALEHGRLYDDLTGLPNRLLLRALLAQGVDQARREGSNLAVGVLDLDRFKMVNEALGYAAGDELLRQVAQRLGATLRGTDTLARLGSDEFVLVWHDVDPHGLEAQARAMVSALMQEFVVDGEEVIVGASLGLAHFPGHGGTADELQRAAHAALSQAKSGSGIETYSVHAEPQTNLGVENALARALERGEFEVHYQPLVDARSGKTVTAEALLRWNSPTLGRRSPAEFIPMLERSGMIVAVGDWVLREACCAAREWPDVRVAVNLSARQFVHGDLAQSVTRALEESGLPGDRLELEITESLMMQSPERAAQMLHDLKRTGVRVVLDDFGTGYSNLSYLDRFPLDGLKIDRSFVQGLEGGERGQAIIHAIVQMGRALSLEVVAEGVETADQHATLRGLGVPVLQGYLFGRPTLGWRP